MPAGFYSATETGNVVQIEQDHTSFALSYKGNVSMTLDPATHPQPMRIGEITITGYEPIIAFQGPGLTVNLLHQRIVGNQHTFHFRVRAGYDFSLPIWIFDRAAMGTGAANSGAQVFRADGSLAYHSDNKPLRVVGVIDLVPPPDGSGYQNRGIFGPVASFPVPAGKTYAVVQGSFCYVPVNYDDGLVYDTGDGGQAEVPPGGEPPPNSGNVVNKYQVLQGYHSGSGLINGQIEAGLVQFETFRGLTAPYAPQISTTYGDLMFWVVDVTNY